MDQLRVELNIRSLAGYSASDTIISQISGKISIQSIPNPLPTSLPSLLPCHKLSQFVDNVFHFYIVRGARGLHSQNSILSENKIYLGNRTSKCQRYLRQHKIMVGKEGVQEVSMNTGFYKTGMNGWIKIDFI